MQILESCQMPMGKKTGKKTLGVSEDGASLIEVMIGGLVAALMILAISETIVMGSKTYRAFLSHNSFSGLKSKIAATVASPASCPTMISGTIDPTLTTPQAISLVTPYGSFSSSSPNNKVGNDLTITSIAFSQLSYSLTPSYLNTSVNKYYQVIGGTITLSATNNEVANGRSFGGKTLSYTFPIVLTMGSATNSAPWSVVSCQSITLSNSFNTGWSGSGATHVRVTAGSLAQCPQGKYVVGYQYSTDSAWYAACSGGAPQCSCTCYGKGCSVPWYAYCYADGCSPVSNPSPPNWWGGPYGTANQYDNCTYQGYQATWYSSCSDYCWPYQVVTQLIDVSCADVPR